MADKVKQGNFLDHLTKGLYDAVVQAQALAENQHIEALSKYVNEDGTPKLTMDLKVRLNKFGKRKSRCGGGIFSKKDAGAISADLGASILPTRNNYANLKVTFEGTDPPEGVVRLNNNLIKQIP